MQTTEPSDDLAAELRTEMRALLVGRARFGLAIILVAIPLFAIVDWISGSQPLAWLYAVKVCELILTALCYAALQRPEKARHAALIFWLSIVVNCGATAFEGVLIGESIAVTILCLSMAFGSGMLLPWGAGAQAAAAVVAGAAVAMNFVWVRGGLPTPSDYTGAAAVITGLVVSVGVAHELRRHWIRLLEEYLARRRGETRIRALNEQLEQRVRERTAELESANKTVEEQMEEQRRTAEALRQSQRELREIVDNSQAVIYVKDADGRYLLVNSRWESLFHIPRAEVPGRTDDDLFPAETAVAFRANDRQVLEADGPLSFEEVVAHDGASHNYLSLKFPMRDDNGVAWGVGGISTDITALKQAEERSRLHQAELAHVLRLHSLSELVAGLAHEINQPLGAIANFASGCRRRIGDGNIDLSDIGRTIEHIAAEAVRAGEILRRIRPLIRKAAPREEVVDCNRVVSEAARVVRSEAQRCGTRVRIEMAPDLPPALGDRIQLEQVVVNLLLNAIDAMQSVASDSRDLLIRTSVVDRTAIQVSVCDRGAGFSPEMEDRLFEPFFTTKSDGLGMGLAISRSIIEAHGGALSGAANVGGGSTFRFTLPVAPQGSQGAGASLALGPRSCPAVA